MPPNTIPIPVPTTRGADAVDYLEAHGYYARNPPIRSSAYEEAQSCEFSFYLKERLGIQPLTKLNEPLVFGGWFHKGLECNLLGMDEISRREAILNETLANNAELETDCPNVPNSLIQGAKNGLAKIRDSALICQEEAWKSHPIPPQYVVLDAEPLLFLEGRSLKFGIRSDLVARLDALLWNKNTNTLWILDAKTTKGSARSRIETCPFEFQTWHYRLIVQELLNAGILHEKYPILPKNVRFGGMMHYVVRRPDLRIKKTDLKVSDAHAEIEYRKRIRNWYQATGEFSHNKSEFSLDPPVIISMVAWPSGSHALDDPEFNFKLKKIDDLCQKPAVPEYFPRSSSYIRSMFNFDREQSTGLSVYAPFYADNSIPLWPQIIQKGFKIKWRDLPKTPSLKL